MEMTGGLLAGMRSAVNDRIVRSWKRISVLAGTEVRSDTAAAPVGLTDISIHLRDIRERNWEHGPHAIVECKRVSENDARLCRRYVVDGIDDRFTAGKYATRYTIAFMVGYVLSGGISAVVGRINRYLSDHERDAECLTACAVLSAAWTRSSTHPRQLPVAPIDLHHAFLTFQAVS